MVEQINCRPKYCIIKTYIEKDILRFMQHNIANIALYATQIIMYTKTNADCRRFNSAGEQEAPTNLKEVENGSELF